MNKIFATIKSVANKIKPKTKLGKFSFVFLLLTVSFLGIQYVYASNLFVDGFMYVFTMIALAVSGWCVQMSIFLLSFIIEIAGYNGYLKTPAVTVGWVMVRDVTNMFFVIILLIIAFGTILGLEQYEWKKLMLKFVLAAVLVNFSRTICGLFIDAAQVFMITFVNAVAATAGGNLITMFSLDKLGAVGEGNRSDDLSTLDAFIGAAGGLFFAALLMGVMFGYMVILLARMLVLWVLIILSPLAFVLSVIPQTQSYAQKWWKEFGSHVLVGPVMIFFLWLTFVTAGAGDIHEHITDKSVKSAQMDSVVKDIVKGHDREMSAGITKILQWDNMVSFFVAIGMLMVGIRVTNELGVQGGGALTKGVDFAKKVAMAGSGATAGMWAAKGGANLAKAGTIDLAKTGLKKGTIGLAKKIASPVVDTAKMAGKRIQGAYLKTDFGQRGLKRKGKLDQLDKGLKVQKEGIEAKGKMEKGGIAGNLDAFVGDRIMEQQIIERKQKGLEDEYVGEKTKKIQEDEEKERDIKIKILSQKAKEEEFNELKNIKNINVKLDTNDKKLMMEARIEARKKAKTEGETDNSKLNIIANNAEKEKEHELKAVKYFGKNIKNLPESEKNVLKEKYEKEERIAIEYNKLIQLGKSESESKQRAIDAGGGLDRVKRAKIEEKAIQGIGSGMLNSFRVGTVGEQRKGKAKTLEEQAMARAYDSVKNRDNKEGYKTMEYDDSIVQKDLAKVGNKDFDGRLKSVKDTYKKVRKLRVKKLSKELTKEEELDLKSGVRENTIVVASMYANGEGEWLAPALVEMSSDFKDVDLNKGENNHLLDLALMTGASKEDMFDDQGNNQDHDKQRNLQEKTLRANLKEKEGAYYRNLMRAKNKDANENGAVENNYQLSKLINENGEEVVGFTNLATSGVSGVGNALATGGNDNGSAIREIKTDYMLSNKKARDVGGASMVSTVVKVIEVNGKKVDSAKGFSSDEMRKKIYTDAIDSLNNFNTEQANFITGGQHNLSAIDSNTGVISDRVSAEIKDNYEKIIAAKNSAYNKTNNNTEKARIRKEVEVFMLKVGLKQSELDRVVDGMLT